LNEPDEVNRETTVVVGSEQTNFGIQQQGEVGSRVAAKGTLGLQAVIELVLRLGKGARNCPGHKANTSDSFP
jgi:hypothetical protein